MPFALRFFILISLSLLVSSNEAIGQDKETILRSLKCFLELEVLDDFLYQYELNGEKILVLNGNIYNSKDDFVSLTSNDFSSLSKPIFVKGNSFLRSMNVDYSLMIDSISLKEEKSTISYKGLYHREFFLFFDSLSLDLVSKFLEIYFKTTSDTLNQKYKYIKGDCTFDITFNKCGLINLDFDQSFEPIKKYTKTNLEAIRQRNLKMIEEVKMRNEKKSK